LQHELCNNFDRFLSNLDAFNQWKLNTNQNRINIQDLQSNFLAELLAVNMYFKNYTKEMLQENRNILTPRLQHQLD